MVGGGQLELAHLVLVIGVAVRVLVCIQPIGLAVEADQGVRGRLDARDPGPVTEVGELARLGEDLRHRVARTAPDEHDVRALARVELRTHLRLVSV